jgi:hypothetical protein
MMPYSFIAASTYSLTGVFDGAAISHLDDLAISSKTQHR